MIFVARQNTHRVMALTQLPQDAALLTACLSRTAITLVGPPDPPTSLCTRLYTRNPLAGRRSVLARFSRPQTLASPSTWWVWNTLD